MMYLRYTFGPWAWVGSHRASLPSESPSLGMVIRWLHIAWKNRLVVVLELRACGLRLVGTDLKTELQSLRCLGGKHNPVESVPQRHILCLLCSVVFRSGSGLRLSARSLAMKVRDNNMTGGVHLESVRS